MTRARTFFSGTLVGYSAMTISLIVSIFLTPIILKYIGKEQYGLWAIFGEILSYLGITDLGVTNSVSLMIARCDREKEMDYINRLVSTSIVIQGVLAVAFLTLGMIFSFFLPSVFNISGDLYSISIWTFVLTVIVRALSLPLSSMQGVLRGLKEQAWEHTGIIITLILSTLFTIIFLNLGLELLSLPLATFISTLAGFIINFLRVRKLVPYLKVKAAYFERKMLGQIFSFSIYLTFFGISLSIILQTDNIVIGHYIGLSMVTVYVITNKGYAVLLRIIGLYNNILRPFYAEMHKKEEKTLMINTFLLAVRTTSAISLACAFLYFFLNKIFVTLWVGEENFGGVSLTAVFAWLLFYHNVIKATAVPLSGALRIKEISLMSMLEAFLNLFMSIVLVGWLGATGVAIGTALGAILTSAWFIPLMTCKTLGLDYKTYWIEGVLKGIMPLLPLGLCLMLLYGRYSVTSQISIASVFAIVSLGVMYFFVLEKKEREYLIRKVTA